MGKANFVQLAPPKEKTRAAKPAAQPRKSNKSSKKQLQAKSTPIVDYLHPNVSARQLRADNRANLYIQSINEQTTPNASIVFNFEGFDPLPFAIMAGIPARAAEANQDLNVILGIIYEHLDTVEQYMVDDLDARALLHEKAALSLWLAKLEESKLTLDEIRPLLEEVNALVTLKADLLSCARTIIIVTAKITECQWYITNKGAPQAGALGGDGNANYDVKQLCKMELSDFDGNAMKYKKWRKETKDLLAGNMSDAIRVKRIVDCLTKDAKLYVGDAGKHLDGSLLLWAYLDKRYQDDWQINLSVVSGLVNLIQTPLTTVGSIVELPDTFHNAVTAIESRELTTEQILQTVMFAIMPIDIKNEIINRVRVLHPDKKAFTWDEVSPSIYQINTDFDNKYQRKDPLDMIVFGNKSIHVTTILVVNFQAKMPTFKPKCQNISF